MASKNGFEKDATNSARAAHAHIPELHKHLKELGVCVSMLLQNDSAGQLNLSEVCGQTAGAVSLSTM